MKFPHFNKAFPTLFKPIVVPEQPSDDESDAVLRCFKDFLLKSSNDDADDTFLFPNGNQDDPVMNRVLKSMHSFSESFCALHGEGGDSGDLSPGLIHQSILDGLHNPGLYWGMFCRAQNAVLLVHRLLLEDKMDIARVYLWEVQAPNKEVMGWVECIRQSCPRSATSVPWERFQQYAIAECLSDLATNTPDKAIPKSQKGGEEFVETREPIRPMYLTEYFHSALGGVAIPTATIHGVHKKMNDDVIYSGGALPWRRAPLWAALKSLLHVVCVMETTKATDTHCSNSGIIYKIIIQNFLTFCLDKVEIDENEVSGISSSSIVEGARKIVRRIAKLQKVCSESHWYDDRFTQRSLYFCERIVKEKMKLEENKWKEKCQQPITCVVDLSKIDPEKDVVHQLRTSNPVLEKLVQLKGAFYCVNDEEAVPEPSGRNMLADADMTSELLDLHRLEIELTSKRRNTEPEDVIGQLHDVAISMSQFFRDVRDGDNRAHLFLNSVDEADKLVAPMMELIGSYSKIGLAMHPTDPRGCGEIVLTSLVIVIILDILACKHFPMVKEHNLGIDPTFLHYIFVSTVSNKKLLCELEIYIKERNIKSTFPSSIEPMRSKDSLSVRFARSDSEMEQTLSEIQKICKSNQDQKELERLKLMQKYNDLRNEFRGISCSCSWTYDSRGCTDTHLQCRRCVTEKQAKNIKLAFYEKLLPPEKTNQYAVVFELKQPYLLAAQRNAILIFASFFSADNWYTETDQYFLWKNELRLRGWKTCGSVPLEVCELGSHRKKISSSHYGRNKIHVTHDRCKFVVEHDYETVLMGMCIDATCDIIVQGVKGMVDETFAWDVNPNLVSIPLADGSRYKNLEKHFSSFTHNENEIVASKSTCDEDLSMIEFEKAGTLRDGPSHQLINLCACFQQRDISFDREEIMSAISAVIWQAGPPCSVDEILKLLGGINDNFDHDWYRKPAEILKDSDFVKDICRLLHATIDSCSSSWAKQNILLNVTHVAMFIFEHVSEMESCAKGAADIVKKCRQVAKRWIRELMKASNSSDEDNVKQKLQARIADVAATGSLTFADSDYLLSTKDDVGLWVYFRAVFNDNFAPAEIAEGSNRRSHLVHAFHTAEIVASRLQSLLQRSKLGLDNFLKSYWSSACTCSGDGNWKQYEARNWFHLDYVVNGKICKLQVDTISGIFLVNGCPCKNLPRSISSSEVYIRLFGKSIFDVQPCGNQGYRTSLKVNGCFYEFYPSPNEDGFEKAPIIIQEYYFDDNGDDEEEEDDGSSYASKSSDGSMIRESFRAMLIPWYLFKHDFPEQLVHEFSHWFIIAAPSNKGIFEDWIYFRPVSYKTENDYPTTNSSDFFLNSSSFELDCRQRLVFETKTRKKLVDIQSETFQELCSNVFARLSPKSRIHVYLSSDDSDERTVDNEEDNRKEEMSNCVTISIPLLQNMRFTLDRKSGVIHSSDFRGLKVAKNQNFGSLIGMEHGLLFEGYSSAENKIFICPHGKVDRYSRKDGSVSVDVGNIRSPAFFRYEIRQELKDLRSCTKDRMASLFLAQLHASTSSIFADPFSCTTGLQKSLTILRSGLCSGNLINTLDDDEIRDAFLAEAEILCEIAAISPSRTEYHLMEMNDLISSNFDAICAHPAYAFLVKLRLNGLGDSLKAIGMNMKTILHLNKSQHELVANRTSELSRRAYFQRRELYPKDSLLQLQEEEILFPSAAESNHAIIEMADGFDHQTVDSMQKIGYETQNRQFDRTNWTSLSDLLCSTSIDDLVGVTGTATLTGGPRQCFESLLGSKLDVDFCDVWLNLYVICRTKVNKDPHKLVSVGLLLTWVMGEYPEYPNMEEHLQLLSIVASDPDQFPLTESYGVSRPRFEKPHEQDYLEYQVRSAINLHLRDFSESCPSRNYEYNRWVERQNEHNTRQKKESNELEYYIRSLWRNGKRSIESLSHYSLLYSPVTFLIKINKLFSRWAQAIQLHVFIGAVTDRLSQIRLDECPSIVKLDHDQTVDTTRIRTNFVLPSRPNFNQVSGIYDATVEMKKIRLELKKIRPYAPLSADLNSSETNGQRDSTTEIVFQQLDRISSLKHSNFVEKHPEYQPVWNALVDPLNESFRLASSEECHSNEPLSSLRSKIEGQLIQYEARADSAYEVFYNRLSRLLRLGDEIWTVVGMQVAVGLWDSISPYNMLLHYMDDTEDNAIFKEMISFAITIKHVMRARRCRRLLIRGNEGFRKHFLSDLSNPFSSSNPGSNESWDAYKYPEFLLFEIDNDVGIRDAQAKVAFEILEENDSNASNTNNRLMQLNMGEGKTAVIMPLVLACAANGDSLARATVLSSLYKTNASDWQYRLGGLLKRRVYPMLCRRDLPIGVDEAKLLLKTCQQIKNEKHVIVTVPEHRLSLENKAIELASDHNMSKNLPASRLLHEVVTFLSTSTRDFLDESDEILSPKYQLIYTIGVPCDMEGSQIRWEVHNCIYECLAQRALSLLKEFGPDTIEILSGNEPLQKTEYVGLRLLEGSKRCDEAYVAIKANVVNYILCGHSELKLKLTSDELRKWKRCVSGKGRGDDIKDLPPGAKTIALCLRGMLEHDVLKVVLFKRWRVQYGNHPKRLKFYMAVPYRAKDDAAERTEFGHPDIALSLTFCHYFQAGLQKSQLRDVFERLDRMSKSDTNAEYNSWTKGLSASVTKGISSFEGVNIEDMSLFSTKLYPLFRKHMRVIRFWLFRCVLPVQAKQFPMKLLSTAPELCRSSQLCNNWKAVTRGFSGTDDLSLLLPPTIVQKNLEELKMTNGLQLKNLLRKENNTYTRLVDDNTANELLEKVLTKKSEENDIIINVVLDAGALVLQMSNRSFVESWLKCRPDMEAGAFFQGSSIFTLTKDGMLLKFDESPYCDDMSGCLLYLDDIHTRGSDFRLPLNTRAVLTLGKGMQKDKCMQACMRLRLLGRGQSLTFAASREVNLILESDFGLRSRCNEELGFVSTILEWTISNSVKRICDLMPYAVSQVRSTFRKADAYSRFYFAPEDVTDVSLEKLAVACIENETLDLQQMYGHERGVAALSEIVGRQLDEFLPGQRDLRNNRSIAQLAGEFKERIERLASYVTVNCSMLDEEQERELEQELEEEIQIERPPPAVPQQPHFSAGLFEVLDKGTSRPINFRALCKRHLLPLSSICRESFYDSKIASQLETHDKAYVTKDFVCTVKGKSGKDFYIKNIRWLLKWDGNSLHHHANNDYPVVVVSNYEADQLSSLLSSSSSRIQQQGKFPSLYAFTPITRLQQPTKLLTVSSCDDTPAIVHVYGGSVNADGELLIQIRDFLSVFPRPSQTTTLPLPLVALSPSPLTPTIATATSIWDEYFDAGHINRDGFVPPESREVVMRYFSREDYNGVDSPFEESPVKHLLHFYNNSRHLESELPTSSVGKLLGASQLMAEEEEEEEDDNDERTTRE